MLVGNRKSLKVTKNTILCALGKSKNTLHIPRLMEIEARTDI